jgi:hypothetical protein
MHAHTSVEIRTTTDNAKAQFICHDNEIACIRIIEDRVVRNDPLVLVIRWIGSTPRGLLTHNPILTLCLIVGGEPSCSKDVMTPVCACGDGRETARHVAAYCQLEEITRRELPFAIRTHRDFDTAVRAASQTRWLMRRQRVGGYRVALQIADGEEPVVTPPARRQPRWSS